MPLYHVLFTIRGMAIHDAAARRKIPSGFTRKQVKKNDVIAIDKAFISRSYALHESLDD